MNELQNRRILIIEDMRAIHDDMIKVLAPAGQNSDYDALAAKVLKINRAPALEPFEISSAFQGKEGFEMVKAALAAGRPYALAFVDMRMPPGWDGLETIQHIWELDKEIQIVICTAYSDYTWEEIAATLGVSDRMLLLKKPFDTAEVLQLASAMTRKWQLARQAELSIERLEEMVREKTSALEQEVQERRNSELALLRSEDRYALAVAGANDGIWDWDMPANTVFYSERWKAMIGYSAEEISNSPDEWMSRIHPEDLERMHTELTRHIHNEVGQFHCEYRLRHKEGHFTWVLTRGVAVRDESGAVMRIAGSQTDIDARKLMELQTRRSQRLEAIGTVAGGVAHDLNNTLTPILMGAEWMRMNRKGEPKQLDMIEASAERASDMVKQLLTFARGAEGSYVPIRPDTLLGEMGKFVRGSFPKNILFRCQNVGNLPAVRGDLTQLHQVLLNLCVNARDAMPNGGLLTLVADRVVLTSSLANAIPESRPGEFVVFRVEDTGTGIPRELLDRIFDPFFTTKDVDKGTGLGLSTVLGIVKGHHGFLQVDSQTGRGSAFNVYIPVDKRGDTRDIISTSDIAATGNGETILFVDDESVLRDAARDALVSLNFKVVAAVGGTEALIEASKRGKELDAVVTDFHMPRMDGLEFVRTLRQTLPDIPVVVISGRLDPEIAEQFKAVGNTWRIDKPFTQTELARVLNLIFKGPNAAGKGVPS